MALVTEAPIVKNEEQIAGIRKSCTLAANTLKFAGEQIKEGMTSEELDKMIYEYIKDHKGVPASLGYMNFPKSSCISFNEVVCHGIPNARTFKNGDIVKVDIATILSGWYGDNCATFAIGEISQEAQHLVDVATKCLELGIREVKPNAPLGNIGKAISKYANNKKCSVVYEYTGHGVGCQFHESPHVLHHKDRMPGPEMQPGWIFTIEPMINLGQPKTLIDKKDGWTVSTADSSLSAQFEHTVLVTESGNEILTLPSKEAED